MEHAKSNGSFDEPINNPSTSNTELVEQTPVQDTPFHIVRMDKKYFLALGKYRLTELFDDYAAVEAEVINSTWDLLFRVISVAVTESINQERMLASQQQPTDIFKTNPHLDKDNQ